MVKLHYAPYAVGENTASIFEYTFEDWEDLLDKIEFETHTNCKPITNVVYLCSFELKYEETAHILIDRNPDFILTILDEAIYNKEVIEHIWLFTCSSFEDAYKTALDMKEGCDYDSEFTYE